jgi:hypothetical protein
VLPGVVPRQYGEVTPVALDLGVIVRKLFLGDPVPLEDRAEADEIADVLQLVLDVILLPPFVKGRDVGANVECHLSSTPFCVEAETRSEI